MQKSQFGTPRERAALRFSQHGEPATEAGLRTRRGVLAALAGLFTSGFSLQRFFQIGWEEEVQTAGPLLVVSVKYTYENLGGLLEGRYERAILRRTDIAFDTGGPLGRFSQSFDHHRVDMIQPVGDTWYLVLETRGGPPSQVTKDGTRQQIWGRPENALGQKCWRLDGAGFARASLLDVPATLLKPNLLMDYAPAKELASLDGKRLTLAMKAAFEARFPVAPPAGRIERPSVAVPQR